MRNYLPKTNIGDIPDSVTPYKFGAGEANSVLTELATAVKAAGLTTANASGLGEDTTQLAQASLIAALKGQSFDTYGTADAIVLVPKGGVNGLMLPPNYTSLDGAVASFTATATNTGPVTIGFGQTPASPIGVKDLYLNGAPLSGGEIVTGKEYRVKYSVPLNRFDMSFSVGIASETTSGIVELATAAETIAGIDNTRAVHPAGVAAAIAILSSVVSGKVDASKFTGTNSSLAPIGHQHFPGGLLLQWGFKDGNNGASLNMDITFPLAFDAVFGAYASHGVPTTNLDAVANYRSNREILQMGSPTNTGFEAQLHIQDANTVDTRRMRWLAIGTS